MMIAKGIERIKWRASGRWMDTEEELAGEGWRRGRQCGGAARGTAVGQHVVQTVMGGKIGSRVTQRRESVLSH